MSADVSDLSLVRRVQRGDKGAFDALVLKYQHKLVKLVMRYVRNPAEAEDIAQEAFIKAYRALPQEICNRANEKFLLLKANQQHPSLQFKKLGERQGQEIWSARVTLN